MKDKKLRQYHDGVFHGTKYWTPLPRRVSRSLLERRLFFYYALHNYHYKKGSEEEKAFRKKAMKVLTKPYKEEITEEERALRTLSREFYFRWENVKDMPISEVDRYLATIGLWANVSEESRRRMLWEWFRERPRGVIRSTGGPRINNQRYLVDIILENPNMCYDEFRNVYGNAMPTVTRASFCVARSRLRKAGYKLPRLSNSPMAATRRGIRAR